MIAPAITRRLKLDPEIRTTAGGGVSVTDTMSSVPNTVAHMSTRPAKRRRAGFVRRKAEIRRALPGRPAVAEQGYGCVETLTFHRGTSKCAETNGMFGGC